MDVRDLDPIIISLGLLVAGWALLANRHELARFERWSWKHLGMDFGDMEEFTVQTTAAAGLLALVAAGLMLVSAFLV